MLNSFSEDPWKATPTSFLPECSRANSLKYLPEDKGPISAQCGISKVKGESCQCAFDTLVRYEIGFLDNCFCMVSQDQQLATKSIQVLGDLAPLIFLISPMGGTLGSLHQVFFIWAYSVHLLIHSQATMVFIQTNIFCRKPTCFM